MSRKHKYIITYPLRPQGFTLVEMMIAMTLGMFLIIGVGYAYIGSRQTYRLQDALARMQEGARYTFETMAFDIRMAGSAGCGMLNPSVNSLSAANKLLWYGDFFNQPLTGYEDAHTTAPTTDSVRTNVSTLTGHNQSDALAVMLVDKAREYRVTGYAANAFTVTPTPSALQTGEIVIATDCQSPLVSTATVAGSVITTTGATAAYSAGSRVFGMIGNIYYIRLNAAGEPTLYRQHLTASGGVPVTTAEELVEGVEDMQITYGMDTTPTTADHIVDTYLDANGVNSATVAGVTTTAEKWKRVLSVKISLLMRTTEDSITTAPQAYHYPNADSAATTPTDRRLRKAFTTTIAVRNRL